MKARKSILDPWADQLAAWDAENVTLQEMRQRLAAAGCRVSVGRISAFLSAQRQRALMATVLGNIASGAQMNREIEAAFARNPEPHLQTLVGFIKRLLLTLQVRGSVQPELLDTANALFRSLMDYMRIEQKARELELHRQKIELLSRKAEQADKTAATLSQPLSEAEKAARIREIYGL